MEVVGAVVGGVRGRMRVKRGEEEVVAVRGRR